MGDARSAPGGSDRRSHQDAVGRALLCRVGASGEAGATAAGRGGWGCGGRSQGRGRRVGRWWAGAADPSTVPQHAGPDLQARTNRQFVGASHTPTAKTLHLTPDGEPEPSQRKCMGGTTCLHATSNEQRAPRPCRRDTFSFLWLWLSCGSYLSTTSPSKADPGTRHSLDV